LGLRHQIEDAVSGRAVEAEQVGEQRPVGGAPFRLREQRFQLLEAYVVRVVGSEAGGAAEPLDHGPQRAVAVVGRALVADAGVRLGDGVEQGADDPRLADPGLPH
jgi:hypothetical protein